jgi:hypothetical protein
MWIERIQTAFAPSGPFLMRYERLLRRTAIESCEMPLADYFRTSPIQKLDLIALGRLERVKDSNIAGPELM